MDDCKALIEAGDLLREQQIRINDELKHQHDKLSLNDALRARNDELLRQLEEHGRAVRQSVQLQNEADAALSRGDVDEAKRLMTQATQSLPSKTPKVSAQPDKDTPEPSPDKAKGRDDSPSPAPPAKGEPVRKDTPKSDNSGMEQRLMTRIDQGFEQIEAKVGQIGLPDGYREVFEEFSPDDLRTVLEMGHKKNQRKQKVQGILDSKRGNPFRRNKSDHSNRGVAEDGNPNN